jgi:hypothetical protein
MQLDRVATERVLDSIRYALPSRWSDKSAELRSLAAQRPDIGLAEFLEESGLELDDIYVNNRSWSDLREAAGLPSAATGPAEVSARRALGRLLHIDDPERLNAWPAWLREPVPPDASVIGLRERRLLRMLLVQLFPDAESLAAGAAMLWQHPQVRAELVELLDVLRTRIEHVPIPLTSLPDVPLTVHARYTRAEILAAASTGDGVKVRPWREGTTYDKELRADFFVFTLDKTSGQFSPTTRYQDFAISRELIHWESQSTTTASSPTGQRYQRHAATGHHILLFSRLSVEERAFVFLGPATYVSHVGELPMAITWRLEHPLPGDLFQQFAAAVA